MISPSKATKILYHPTLVRIKGKRHIQPEIMELSAKSLNKGDSFVLDTEKQIFVWNGSSSSATEKARAADIAAKYNITRHFGFGIITVLNEQGNEEFW